MPICTSAPLLGVLLCKVISHVEIIETNKQTVVDECVCDAFRLHGSTHPSHPFRRAVLRAEDCRMDILPALDQLKHEAYLLVAWYILVCNEDCAQTIEEGIEIILLTQFMHMA